MISYPGTSISALKFKRSHSNMNREHRTRPQLYYSVSGGTKDGCVQRTSTTRSHDHEVGLCFDGELNDLLVWLAESYYHLDDAPLSHFGHNGFLHLDCHILSCAFELCQPRDIFQHVQQRKFRAVLLGHRDRVL